jgi:hypothetical protein
MPNPVRNMGLVCAVGLAWVVGCSGAPTRDPGVIHWRIDSTESIGGHSPQVLGAPVVIGSGDDLAVEFDGEGDGLELPLHPLAGAGEFTVEVVFRPDAGGPREQRFLHLQQDGSKDRVLLEIRVTGGGERWFLDTFVKSNDESTTLFARTHEHPMGPWYHAALVVDEERMQHYVDGELELSRPIEFQPQGEGRTSIGVRINRVSWFKGAIREVRFTRRALDPAEFLAAASGAL